MCNHLSKSNWQIIDTNNDIYYIHLKYLIEDVCDRCFKIVDCDIPKYLAFHENAQKLKTIIQRPNFSIEDKEKSSDKKELNKFKWKQWKKK